MIVLITISIAIVTDQLLVLDSLRMRSLLLPNEWLRLIVLLPAYVYKLRHGDYYRPLTRLWHVLVVWQSVFTSGLGFFGLNLCRFSTSQEVEQ